MLQLLVPAKLYAKEGVDVIANTKNNHQLRDLGVELLAFGIKVMGDCGTMGELDQQLLEQYRQYYDMVCKFWNYTCNQGDLEAGWTSMIDSCFDIYEKMLANHQQQSFFTLQSLYG